MNRTLHTLAACSLAVAIAACPEANVTPAPTPGLLVRTSQSSYVIPSDSSQFTIPVTLTNNTGDVLLLDGVGRDFIALEKRVGEEWEVVYRPVYTMQAAMPIRLGPGQSRQLGIWLSLSSEGTPRLEDPDGTYRAVFAFGRDAPETGIETRTNEFELRRPQ